MRTEVILPATDSAAMLARVALNDAIPPPDLAGRFDDARLALSEVVANAVVHGGLRADRDVLRLTIDNDDDRFRAEVEQATPAGDAHRVEPRLDDRERPGG